MARRRPVAIEPLEGRALFSAAVATLHPLAIYDRPAAKPSSADVQGYTPAQIRTAYGFDGVTFGSGSAAPADGTGQTIAIVDAYNDPKVAADLAVFDDQFGLAAPPSLKVVGQSGGSTLPQTNADWAGETALDVEWAHAIAPGANLLLVETKSDGTDDLLAGVDYARGAPGVSVVSMSWGGSESVSWADGGGDTTAAGDDDTHFVTPVGHRGVTFVAAAGDSGSKGGVLWPAAAPNVVSVGGTTLDLNDDGTVNSELGWSGTSGGYSQVETEPAFQKVVQTTGNRSGPDVAYAADPDDGFAVYDSLPDQGYSGWQEVGGTSAGAPQWAALVAVADQGRTLAGSPTLFGADQTLPDLYSLYSAYGTAGYDAYTADFTDVQAGGDATVRFRNGRSGNNGHAATVGYDLVTGLGSPHAASIVTALVADNATTGTTTPGGTGSGGTGSSGPTSTTTSPVTATFLTVPPAEAVAGSAGVVRLQLTNTGTARFSGTATVTLLASTDATASADGATLATLPIGKLTLGVGGRRTVTLKFDYSPETAVTSETLLATVAAPATSADPSTGEAAMAVAVEPATADLSAAFATTTAVVTRPGKRATAVVRVTNAGNTAAVGTVGLTLYTSADGLLDATAGLVTTLPPRKLKLAPGKSVTLRVTFAVPADLTPGTTSLVANLSPAVTPADANAADDVAVAATTD